MIEVLFCVFRVTIVIYDRKRIVYDYFLKSDGPPCIRNDLIMQILNS